MDLVTKDHIARSIGAQPDVVVQEILRTGVCVREWTRALAIVADQTSLAPQALQALSPRMQRLVDLLTFADPLSMAFQASRVGMPACPVARVA